MVGCDNIVKHAQAVTPFRLKQPLAPQVTVSSKLEQKLSLVTTMGYVPHAMLVE